MVAFCNNIYRTLTRDPGVPSVMSVLFFKKKRETVEILLKTLLIAVKHTKPPKQRYPKPPRRSTSVLLTTDPCRRLTSPWFKKSNLEDKSVFGDGQKFGTPTALCFSAVRQKEHFFFAAGVNPLRLPTGDLLLWPRLDLFFFLRIQSVWLKMEKQRTNVCV